MTTPYYAADGITIYHGDCCELHEWRDADVVLTDPPYGIQWRRSVNNRRASKAHAGIANDHDTSLRDTVLALMAHVPAIVFGSFYAPYPAGVKHVVIWHKPPDAGVVGTTTGFRRDAEPIFLVGPWPKQLVRLSSVISCAGGMSAVVTATGHPHTKPVALLCQLMQASPPGRIADPCMGTGSTLLAAQRLGRAAVGVELEERYCEIAVRRLQQKRLPFDGYPICRGESPKPDPQTKLWENINM
jgi:DNA methylase